MNTIYLIVINHKRSVNFSKLPFVYITSLFIGGIVAVKFFPIENFTIFIGCIISCLISWLFSRKFAKYEASSSLVLIPFFFLGAISFNNAVPELEELHPSEYGLMINVNEIDSSTRYWRKSLCTIVGAVDSVKVEKRNEQVLLYILDPTIKIGDQLFVYTELRNIENRGNPGEFDAVAYWNNQGIYRSGFVGDHQITRVGFIEVPWYKKFPADCRKYLSEVLSEHLDGNTLALAKALVLGDKELLTTEVKASFSNSGAMHVLAVSGLHVGIILMIVQFVLGRFKRFISKNSTIIMSVIVIWMYAAVTDFSPSVIRASFMFSLLSLAKMYSKQANSTNVLFFTAFIMLLIEPNLIFNLGFQLSYLAMLGIFTLYKPIYKLFYIKNKPLNWLWQGTVIGISAQLLTVPLTLYHFHQFPNYFALTNIGIMVLAGTVLSVALVLFSLHWMSSLSSLLGVLLGGCFNLLLWFVQFVEGIPGAVATGFTLSIFVVIAIYLSILTLVLFKKNRMVIYTSIATVMILFTLIQFSRYKNLTSNEMVFFNHKQFTSVVKVGDEAVCFYVSNQKRPKHLAHVIGGYSKTKPASMSFHRLEVGMTTMKLGGRTLKIERMENGLFFYFAGKTIAVRFRASFPVREEWKIVDMPYLSANDYHESLSEGAVTFEF